MREEQERKKNEISHKKFRFDWILDEVIKFCYSVDYKTCSSCDNEWKVEEEKKTKWKKGTIEYSDHSS